MRRNSSTSWTMRALMPSIVSSLSNPKSNRVGHVGSSAGSCHTERYGCRSASSHEMRSCGSNARSLATRSSASGLACGNSDTKGTPGL